MKLLIGFFGLNRSLTLTLPSIQQNIFTPLTKAGYELTKIAHFNAPTAPIQNRRAREYNVTVNSWTDTEKLGLNLCWIEPQPEVNPEYIRLAMESPDMLQDRTGDSRRNVFHQLHSLARLWHMTSLLDISQYQGFLFIRPDLMYLDEINPELISGLSSGIDLITPSWHRWGGLNDRFALCSLRGARIYATDRFKNLERRISLIGGLHPESLLHLSAREASLTLAFTGLRAARIRGNGRQQEENFQL